MRLRIGLTLWLLLFTAKVYFAGVTISRTRMVIDRPRDRPGRPLERLRRRRARSCGRSLTRAPSTPRRCRRRPRSCRGWHIRRSPLSQRVLIWPFAALVRPFFASDWISFRRAAARCCLLVLAAFSAWVLTADDTFERVASCSGLRRDGRGVRKTAIAGRGQAGSFGFRPARVAPSPGKRVSDVSRRRSTDRGIRVLIVRSGSPS